MKKTIVMNGITFTLRDKSTTTLFMLQLQAETSNDVLVIYKKKKASILYKYKDIFDSYYGALQSLNTWTPKAPFETYTGKEFKDIIQNKCPEVLMYK